MKNTAVQQERQRPSRGPRVLLTEQQAAGLLQLSPRALQAWRCAGGGPPFIRISRRCIRYRPEDLERWIARRLRSSTSDPGPLPADGDE